jgi:hypothetical protein
VLERHAGRRSVSRLNLQSNWCGRANQLGKNT